VGFAVDKVALGQVFLRVLLFSPVNIIPPLLHMHLSPPHEVCDSSDQAAHYHHLGPKLGALFLTGTKGWKRSKKVKSSTRQNVACLSVWKSSLNMDAGYVVAIGVPQQEVTDVLISHSGTVVAFYKVNQ
jgi:hypothetical protein